jgi:eukaryotic-like serine/threonine-protein kinase
MKKLIGRYEILGQIGTGGFGTVYRARDPELERDIALKVLSTKLLESESDRKRFLKEARVAAALSHPNIVVIHELGTAGDLPYIAMEYLPGSDLRALIRERQPLPLRHKLNIALQVARALRHAHAHGVIHRDVKPENIRILPSGLVKLMDFGIAKVAEDERSHLTTTGSVVGSSSYISPEQARGEVATAASDVFSFGVVLYELLTYRRPFNAPNLAGLIYRILTEEPAPIDDPEVPEEMRELVAACLKKTASERLPSFDPVVQRLTRLRQQFLMGADASRTEEPLVLPAAPPETPMQTPASSEATAAADLPLFEEPTPWVPRHRIAAVSGVAVLAAALFLIVAIRALRLSPPEPPGPAPTHAAPTAASRPAASPPAGRTPAEAPILAVLAPSPTPTATPSPSPPPTQTPSPSPSPSPKLSRASPTPPAQAATGTLRLSVEPVALVQIDENLPIRSPLPPLPLAPGLHRIQINREGYRPVDQRLELLPGQVLERRITLEPLTGGWVVFVLKGPSAAFLQIDGGPTMRLPLARVSLSQGRHQIQVSRMGWRTLRTEIEVPPDREITVPLVMEPGSD